MKEIDLTIPKELNLVNCEPLKTINSLQKTISDIEKDINQNYVNLPTQLPITW